MQVRNEKRGLQKQNEGGCVVNTNPSAFARHQEQQANAERVIEVTGTLTWKTRNLKEWHETKTK